MHNIFGGIEQILGQALGGMQNQHFMNGQTFFQHFMSSFQPGDQPRVKGWTKEQIATLPVNSKACECYICHEDLGEGEGLELPCEHAFHNECV